MTRKEKIMSELREIADELQDTTNWNRVEFLADYLQDIIDEIEEL